MLYFLKDKRAMFGYARKHLVLIILPLTLSSTASKLSVSVFVYQLQNSKLAIQRNIYYDLYARLGVLLDKQYPKRSITCLNNIICKRILSDLLNFLIYIATFVLRPTHYLYLYYLKDLQLIRIHSFIFYLKDLQSIKIHSFFFFYFKDL